MRRSIFYIILLISFAAINATEFSVYEANYPNVKDYNVNVSDVSLIVRPAGDYVELNLYMTVSYDFQSWFFKNYNELEFLWQFDLPQDAIIHKFWCWQGDSIMTAEIMDKWTAELLFNNVSNPIRNPGLLVQSLPNGQGTVTNELRIYPIMRNQPKKFMIQYLLPARPTGSGVRVWLPMNQLLSQNTPPIKQLTLLYKYGNSPYEPKLIGTSVIGSQDRPSLAGWEVNIPVSSDQFVEMELPSPIQNTVFMTTDSKDGDNFYHLALYPPAFTKVSTPRKILFVVDYNRLQTDGLDGDFILSYLKETIMQSFSEEDSINVLAAYDQIVSGGNKWIPCRKDSIDMLFQRVMMRSFPSYNNLLPLISTAADFINSNAGNGEVLFLTNTSTINLSASDQTALAVQIVNKFKFGTKIHFFDLYNQGDLIYYWDNNTNSGYYETQMQSFYGQITYPTSGDLFFLRYNTLQEMLYSLLFDEISHYESIEVQMRFQNGYANSQHFIALNEGYYPLNMPIMQLGKFTGQFPLDITVLGRYKMQVQKYTITVNESDVVKGNDQIATAWYGGQIQSLLTLPYASSTVTDIINLSSRQGILTPYTGFLVYNHDQNHGYCTTCTDESKGLASIKSNDSSKDSLTSLDVSIYPNPFNPVATINYTLPVKGHVTIKIYNILGATVAAPINGTANEGKYSVKFDGSGLASGVYILTISLESSGKNYFKAKKLILMK
jgi:Secretion system C-terminal sorting domain